MKTSDTIKSLRVQIKALQERIKWLREHKHALDQLPEGVMYGAGSSLDFDRLPHKDVIKVIRALGGKWQKTPNKVLESPKVDYVAQVDGVTVRCWAGEPPPSCRLVEVEELVPEKVIPAHTVKVKKMICTGVNEPLAVAIAQANVPVNGQSTNQTGSE